MTEEPQDGVQYEVQLGETFTGANPKTYHTLQCKFNFYSFSTILQI
jgi:hypothetical protein